MQVKTASLIVTLVHQRPYVEAFAAGLSRHGIACTIGNDHAVACDLAVQWGVRNQPALTRAAAMGAEVCILERGYLGNRKHWTSISFGGQLGGRAAFHVAPNPGRFMYHHGHLLKPWRKREGVALIMGQCEGDMSTAGVNLPAFYTAAGEAMGRLGYEIAFRPHPLAGDKRATKRPLAEDLAGAAVAVTWNSTAAVEAVLAGVPTIAMDEGSMAWPVTGHVFAVPPTPARDRWAHRLAWCQYSVEEMASGYAWAAICDARRLEAAA